MTFITEFLKKMLKTGVIAFNLSVNLTIISFSQIKTFG